MRPITLKITGLNSFMNEQTIDFKTLTDKGLFGIFGPTGSGKSTILDAITIVLFGEIVRKNRDFMNTNCDTLSVSYEFEIGLGNNRKSYIAQRNFRRDKNNNIKTKYARLMEKKSDEELNIIAEKPTEVKKEVQKIIGLTLDDFTRSVVLPQGKFSEFLKLKGKEKRDMLERIFALEKYGKALGGKIKDARNAELKKQSELNGELKRFENLSEEGYKEKEQELEILKNKEKEITEKKKKADHDYEKYKEVWKLQSELKDYNDKLKSLNDRKEGIENLKNISLRGENAYIIKPHIEKIINTENEMKINDEKLIKYQKELQDIEEQILITDEKYRKIQTKKDIEIPILIKKENELNTAIEMEKDIQKLEEQRNKLAKEYKDVLDKKKGLDEKSSENEKSIGSFKKQLDDKEKIASEIKIDIEYRENIEKALDVERDYKRQHEKQENLGKNLGEKKTSYKNNKKEHSQILIIQEQKEQELNELIQNKKNLEENCPGDEDSLLKAQADLNKLSQIIKDGMENTKKIYDLELKYDNADKNKIDLEVKLNKLKEEMQEKENRKNILESDIKKIEKENAASLLAANLKENEPCPVCGAIHHITLAVGVEDVILQKKKDDQKTLEIKIKEQDKILRDIENRYIFCKNEATRLKDEIKPLNQKLEEINLEELNKTYEGRNKAFETLKNSIEHWNKDKKNVDKRLNIIKEEKSKIDIKEAGLRETVKNDELALAKLEEEFSEGIKVFEFLSNTYNSLKNEFKIQSFSDEINRIKKIQKEIDKLQKEQKDLRKKIEKVSYEKEKLDEEISLLSADLKSKLDVGQEKRKNIDSKKKEVEKLTEGKDPSEYIIEVKESIKKINDLVKTLNKQLEYEKSKKEKISKEVITRQQNKDNLNKNFDEQNEKLEGLLKEYNFESKEHVLKAFITKEEIEKLNKEIEEYEKNLRNTLDNIERIKKQLNSEFIDEETWNKILEDKKNLELMIKEKHTQIGALDITLKNMKNDLETLKDINKRYKEVEHKLSLLNDIDKLIQGNKFVEFVAMNQLKYIAREASKRLLSITGNRYALEIDDEGNFTVRDDKNGGVVRETASLSGGETFLTSLALALSLSTQIQLKGSAPLEFFFLDEGFGTLDANLLEVVMTSLEKLHTDKLSVGIISHVEELKNRVPVKILVTPGEHGVDGSKVKLEYS